MARSTTQQPSKPLRLQPPGDLLAALLVVEVLDHRATAGDLQLDVADPDRLVATVDALVRVADVRRRAPCPTDSESPMWATARHDVRPTAAPADRTGDGDGDGTDEPGQQRGRAGADVGAARRCRRTWPFRVPSGRRPVPAA